MRDEDVAKLGDFWSPEAKEKYCLICTSDEGIRLEECLIYARSTRTAEIIENSELAIEVKRRMFDAGVPILRRPPT